MEYILIDNFNGTINIVCKDDGSGEPLILTSLKEAMEQKEEQCQNGIIVPLADTVSVLIQCSGFVDAMRFQEGEEVDEANLEAQLNFLIG